MEPIILEKDAEGRILITAEEIKKMVHDAYEQGYEDGKRDNSTITGPYAPSVTPWTSPWTTTPWLPRYYDADHVYINTCVELAQTL